MSSSPSSIASLDTACNMAVLSLIHCIDAPMVGGMTERPEDPMNYGATSATTAGNSATSTSVSTASVEGEDGVELDDIHVMDNNEREEEENHKRKEEADRSSDFSALKLCYFV